VFSAMDIAAEAQNWSPFYLMARSCADWASCAGGSPCEDSGNPAPGNIKVYSNLKCAVLEWSYPLPNGLTRLPILTDPVGNKYAQHAYDDAKGWLAPDPANYPAGWTLSYQDFSSADSPKLIIQPLNPTSYCSATAFTEYDGNCLYVLAQDVTGIAYHRFYWTGVEPPGVHVADKKGVRPAPVTECASACALSQ
jgi:hypothetical protein